MEESAPDPRLRTETNFCNLPLMGESTLETEAAEMFQHIRKRDGGIVAFDTSKIANALAKAGNATGEFGPEEARALTQQVLTLSRDLGLGPVPDVEEIQDAVERVLLRSSYHKAAKAYILYRAQHAQIRAITSRARVELVESYVDQLDWKVKENSNMHYSLQGLNNYVSADATSEYWLSRIYPTEIRQAHISGDLHVHDLGLLAVYCVGWDLKDLLTQGFQGAAGKAASAPARHFSSALGQIVNFLFTLQGEAAGAPALANFDTLLAPFVRWDNLGYAQVKQALQAFVFNMNVPTRVGFQSPFTNITLDLKAPSTLRADRVIIGGLERDTTYADFQAEMGMINKAFAEVMLTGDSAGRPFTFPIPTYNIAADFDWQDPNLQPLWGLTARYGTPYFANFVNSALDPEDARSMCCRLRLDRRELIKRGGALFGANPLTGSIGVVTLNLPRLGFVSRNEADFLQRLRGLFLLAAKSLEIKRKVLEGFTEKGLYPFSRFYLREVRKGTGRYWRNHFSTIGILGMNEACLNLLGEDM